MALSAIITATVRGHIEQTKENEQLRIEEAYSRLNYAFGMTYTDAPMIGFDNYDRVYQPLPKPADEKDSERVNIRIYLYLKMYELQTGNTLPYDTVVEYFSQEYEPDGSLRLYNNGLHPEIEAYVDWAWLRRFKMEDFIDEVINDFVNYQYDHEDEGFDCQDLSDLTPQMLDELAKKANDPSYDLDLLALQ